MKLQSLSNIILPALPKVDHSFLRQTMLLATALFLIVVPAVNAQEIAEMTANFLIG